MSFSRDRQEWAQQIVVDAAGTGTISEECIGCPATRRMTVAAMDTGDGPICSAAAEFARSYIGYIAGCVGQQACQGRLSAEVIQLIPPASS